MRVSVTAVCFVAAAGLAGNAVAADMKANLTNNGSAAYIAQPAKTEFESFPWSHSNGGPESTQGARLTQRADHGEFITVMFPGKLPAVSAIPGGVKVGGDEIVFGGSAPTDGGDTVYVNVKTEGKNVLTLAGKDVDLNRSQGDIGLFVPDAGYPFREIPDWLIRQRSRVSDEAPAWAKPLREANRR